MELVVSATNSAHSAACARGFPFAQRLGVARRDVRIIRIGADTGEDFPRARAFGALARDWHDRDARHIRSRKASAGPSPDQGRRRRDADFGKIDIDHGLVKSAFDDIHDRARLERGADALLRALDFERAGDDAADACASSPLLGERCRRAMPHGTSGRLPDAPSRRSRDSARARPLPR